MPRTQYFVLCYKFHNFVSNPKVCSSKYVVDFDLLYTAGTEQQLYIQMRHFTTLKLHILSKPPVGEYN